MKKALPYWLIAIAAIGFVVIPRLVVYGTDDFSLTADNHKAFTYGFPFRITDCPASLSHTSASDAALRLTGNVLIFFISGTAVALAMSRAVRDAHHADE